MRAALPRIRRTCPRTGPIFCLLLRVSSDYAQSITGQVYWSNMPCDWLSTAWAYSKQVNGPWPSSVGDGCLVQDSGMKRSKLDCWWVCVTSGLLRSPGPVFCLLLGVSSDYAQPITGQVTEVTCPVIGQAQPELTPSKRQKTGPDHTRNSNKSSA